MVIFRKVATAFKLLSIYGADVAFGQMQDNLRELARSIRWSMRCFTHLPVVRHRRNRSGKKGGLRVLYVATSHEARHGQTSRYRIFNLMQALRGHATTRLETLEEGIDEETLRWADLAVLMRAPRLPETDRFFETAARARVPVVFDIDDIIFLPEYFDAFRRTVSLDGRETAIEQRTFEGFYKNFSRSDFATASTPYIAEKMREHGKQAFVIHNGLNARQLHIAGKASQSEEWEKHGERTILYLSGSQTHSRDFARVLPALERILSEFADVRLCVVGYLDLSGLPPEVAARTRTVPFMEWGRMLAYSARSTINIAPLDTQNPFCHAKSELKYFEAAIVGVPTVASPIDAFRRCIRHGENGLLAETEDEWYAALQALLTDEALYARVRKAAKEDAMAHYAPPVIAAEAEGAYQAILQEWQSRSHDPRLRH